MWLGPLRKWLDNGARSVKSHRNLKEGVMGLVVPWLRFLASNARGLGLIPGK